LDLLSFTQNVSLIPPKRTFAHVRALVSSVGFRQISAEDQSEFLKIVQAIVIDFSKSWDVDPSGKFPITY
jgi:hypothetical protein